MLEKTVLLPYGVIEGEPSYPATNVQIDAVRTAFDEHIVKYPELAGVMGNVQTPLLQFPHVYFYTSCIWDLDYRQRSEKRSAVGSRRAAVSRSTSELIADCYLALKETDPARVRTSGRPTSSRSWSRTGWVGRGSWDASCFPITASSRKSLVLQLRLVPLARTGADGECRRRIESSVCSC